MPYSKAAITKTAAAQGGRLWTVTLPTMTVSFAARRHAAVFKSLYDRASKRPGRYMRVTGVQQAHPPI